MVEKLTLLTKEQIYGKKRNSIWERRVPPLEAIEKYGASSGVTDLALINGALLYNLDKTQSYVNSYHDLKARACWYSTKNYIEPYQTGGFNEDELEEYSDQTYHCIEPDGFSDEWDVESRKMSIRPVLTPNNFDEIIKNKKLEYRDHGVYTVEYGEYPQYAPNENIQLDLEYYYDNNKLKATGNSYTFDSTALDHKSEALNPVTYLEYEYNGKKYVRVKSKADCYEKNPLSNGEGWNNGDYVWIEVSPVEWLVDEKSRTLISKNCLLSGVRFEANLSVDEPAFKGYNSEMEYFLTNYMSKDLFQSLSLKRDYNVEQIFTEFSDEVKSNGRSR